MEEKINILRNELDRLIEEKNFCLSDSEVVKKALELENYISNK